MTIEVLRQKPVGVLETRSFTIKYKEREYEEEYSFVKGKDGRYFIGFPMMEVIVRNAFLKMIWSNYSTIKNYQTYGHGRFIFNLLIFPVGGINLSNANKEETVFSFLFPYIKNHYITTCHNLWYLIV